MTGVLRSLRENLLLKTIALAASVVMWLYVTGERNPSVSVTRTVLAEIKPVGTAPADLIVRVRPDPVLVEVRGPKTQVDSIRRADVKAMVNISLARPDVTSLPVQSYDGPINAPDVTYKDLGPGAVRVDVIVKRRRRVNIEASFNNDAPAGSAYSRPRLDPAWAMVVGTREELQKVARLVVFIETHGGAVRADLPVRAQDRDNVLLEDVQIEPPTTHVALDLVDAPATRTLIVSAPIDGRAAPPFEVASVSTQPDQVVVAGRAEQLQQMSSVSTSPVLIEGIRSDTTRTVALRLPPGVRVRGRPPVVRVTVKVRDATRPRP